MSNSAIRGVLWLALLLILPLPLYVQTLGWVPAYFGLKLIGSALLQQTTLADAQWLLIGLQVLLALLVNGWLAVIYLRLSCDWPQKFRGAIMGIAVLSSLILLSTFAVYRLPLADVTVGVTFLDLYR